MRESRAVCGLKEIDSEIEDPELASGSNDFGISVVLELEDWIENVKADH